MTHVAISISRPPACGRLPGCWALETQSARGSWGHPMWWVGIQFIRIGREVFRVLGLLWLIPVSTAFYFFSIKLQIWQGCFGSGNLFLIRCYVLPTKARAARAFHLRPAVALGQLVSRVDICEAIPICSQATSLLAGQQFWALPQPARHN